MADTIQAGNLTIDSELLSAGALNSYLDKRTGGEISGDVTILSGKYIQTSTPLSVHDYSASDGFIQAVKTKYGDASIGSKAYCILSVYPEENAILISGDFGYSEANTKQYTPTKTFGAAIGSSYTMKQILKTPSMTIANATLSDLMWSVALFDDAFANFSNLTSIQTVGQNTKLIFESLPAFRYLTGKTEADYISEFNNQDKDNALYVRGLIELGNQIPASFYAQHAEGGSSKAVGKFSHAEGRDTLADGRYAHAEGTMTTAGGIASHSEGQNSKAYGRSSHAEGEQTLASGEYGSHSEGRYSEATGESSHAEGYTSKAFGQYSHAEGNQTQAHKTASHTEGQATSAKGSYSHAEGYQSKTGETLVGGDSEAAHAEGYQTYADGDGAHSEGRETKASNNGAHAEGYKSEATNEGAHAEGGIQSSSIKGGTASGKASHAEGRGTTAEGEASHAEGINTHAIGSYSHAEGGNTYAFGNYAHAEGDSVSAYARAYAAGYASFAKGEGAHAEGSRTNACSNFAHAEGARGIAYGQAAHVEGLNGTVPVELTASLSSNSDCQTLLIKGKKETDNYKVIYVNELSTAFYTSAWTLTAEGAADSYVTLDRADTNLSNYTALNCVLYKLGAFGDGAHAEGYETIAKGNGAHAEGYATRAIGNYTHAEGHQSEATGDRCHAEGWNTRANGEGAHAEGSATKALDKYAHAEGYYAEANGQGSHAAGWKAKANEDWSWCWSGQNSGTAYTSKGAGTFCINPKDSALSNVYIGNNNFIACVLNAVQAIASNNTQKASLKAALNTILA